MHDQNGHSASGGDPQAEEAYLEVKDLAILLSHDLEQVRIEKHDQELAYQQKVGIVLWYQACLTAIHSR